MAKETINEVISQEAFDQIRKLNTELVALNQQMNENIANVDKFNKAMNGSSSTKEAANNINNVNSASEKLNNTNSKRLEVERKIKEEGEKMAAQVKQETNNFEQLNKVLEQNIKSQNQTSTSIVKLQRALEANKNAIKLLNEELKNGKISSEEYIKSKTTLIQKQTELKQSLSEEQKNLKLISKDLKANEGSYNQMAARLTQLKTAYRALSEEERNNINVGGVLKKEINNLDESLKGMDKSIGDNQRNVGNYEIGIQSLMSKLPGFGGLLGGVAASATKTGTAFGTTLVTSLKSVGKAMLSLMANPLIALIAVIAMLIMGIVKAIKSNEEQMMRLQKAMAPVARIAELLLKVLQFIADILLDIIENAMKGIGAVMKLMENLPFIGDKIKEINEEIEEQNSMTERQQALVRRLREERILDAKDESRIAKLRLDSSDKENVSAKDRLAMMREANELEDKRAERKIAALKEEYAIEHALNAVNKTGTEGLDKENDLLVQIIQAETERDRLKKQNARQTLAAEREINQEIKQREKIIQEANRRILELSAKTETDKLNVALEKLKVEKTEKLKEHKFTEKQKAVITLQYEKERDAIIEAFTESQREKRKQVLNEIRELTKELNDWRINNENVTEEEIIAAYERNKEAEKELITESYQEKIKFLDIYSIEYIELTNEYNLRIELLEKQHQDNLTKIQEDGIDKRMKDIIDYYDALETEIILNTKNDEAQKEVLRQNDLKRIDEQIESMNKLTTWTQEDDAKHRSLLVQRDAIEEQSAEYQIKLNTQKETSEKQLAEARKQAAMQMVGNFAALGSAIAQNIKDEKQRMKVEAAIALVQALVNEGVAIAEAINDPGDPYTKAFRIIANVAAITAAMVTATSAFRQASSAMPYAEGTDFHKGGDAIVGERYEPELVLMKNKPLIVDKPTFFKDMPIGTKVIPFSKMEHGNNMMSMSETNDLLRAIKEKQTVSINVSDKVTSFINSKLGYTKILNSKFKA